MNYVEYANLGSYLFSSVRTRFATQGYLDAFDFFSIIIWKANRSKSKIARRMINSGLTLDDVVKLLTQAVSQAATPKDKLQVLWKAGFRMPMASAILTVLYPDEFTVYDYRVCDVLGVPQILDSLRDFELVWTGYQDYKAQVIASTPSDLTLREKDLFLWGKSRAEQLTEDIKSGFPTHNNRDEDEGESGQE